MFSDYVQLFFKLYFMIKNTPLQMIFYEKKPDLFMQLR